MRKQEFNSKLISLLPLDEVPVHVPLRRPRPLRFERLPVPVWNPYSRGRLSPAKSEDRKGGEGKTDANLTIFFKHLQHPTPGFGVILLAEIDAVIDPLPPFTFCCPHCSPCAVWNPSSRAASALRSRTGRQKVSGKGGETCSEILEIFYGLTH